MILTLRNLSRDVISLRRRKLWWVDHQNPKNTSDCNNSHSNTNN